jgi:hypothetical protein
VQTPSRIRSNSGPFLGLVAVAIHSRHGDRQLAPSSHDCPRLLGDGGDGLSATVACRVPTAHVPSTPVHWDLNTHFKLQTTPPHLPPPPPTLLLISLWHATISQNVIVRTTHSGCDPRSAPRIRLLSGDCSLEDCVSIPVRKDPGPFQVLHV